jgi:hypothetical protein
MSDWKPQAGRFARIDGHPPVLVWVEEVLQHVQVAIIRLGDERRPVPLTALSEPKEPVSSAEVTGSGRA